MKLSTIAIIGAGAVGATTAYALILKNCAAEILLVDVDEQRCLGEIFDLSDALPFSNCSSIRRGTSQEAGQADIIIIAAGQKQKPNQTRTELLDANKQTMALILQSMQPLNTSALIIVVTNPVDILTLYAQQYAGLNRKQVFGSGTFLDTQRLRAFVAQKLEVAEESVYAYVVGEHGDTQFVAWSSAHVGGIHLSNFPQLNASVRDAIEKQTQQKAYEIIACKDATYFGIATCIASICEAIIFNQKMVIPLSCYQEQLGVCLSLPAVLGAHGIEKILPISLDAQEQQKLQQSAQKLKKLL